MAKKRKKNAGSEPKRQRRAKAEQRRRASETTPTVRRPAPVLTAVKRIRAQRIRELERVIKKLRHVSFDLDPPDDVPALDPDARIVYCIDRPDDFLSGESVWRRVDAGEPGGTPDAVAEEELPAGYVESLLDDADRAIEPFFSKGSLGRAPFLSLCHVSFREVLPRLIETGRFFRHHTDRRGRDVLTPWVLQSCPGPLRVTVSRVGRTASYAVECRYGEGETSLDAAMFRKVFHNGYGYDGAVITELGGPLPDGPRLPRVPHQPEGRRVGSQPHGRVVRLHPRPLVEPGRRGAGSGPHTPHRADARGFRLPAHCTRYRRGKGPAVAAT